MRKIRIQSNYVLDYDVTKLPNDSYACIIDVIKVMPKIHHNYVGEKKLSSYFVKVYDKVKFLKGVYLYTVVYKDQKTIVLFNKIKNDIVVLNGNSYNYRKNRNTTIKHYKHI